MTRREKKQISKELSAIASLRDSDIDTSDIPEITDWSQAVVGRFYLSQKASAIESASSSSAFAPRQLPDPSFGAQLSQGGALAEMTHQQLVLECVEGKTEARMEFLRRFEILALEVIGRAMRQWGYISREVIDDLIRETYLKLGANNYTMLLEFNPSHVNVFDEFVKAITGDVAYEDFRAIGARKREEASGSASAEFTADILRESSNADTRAERAILMNEIDRAIKAVTSEQDRAIFSLYNRLGLTAKEIASVPDLQLTVQDVESVIFRLTELLKSELARSQQGTLAPPIADQVLHKARSLKKKD